MNATEYLKFAIIVPFLFSIQSCQNKSIPNQATSACPKEPTAKLENVKNGSLMTRDKIKVMMGTFCRYSNS